MSLVFRLYKNRRKSTWYYVRRVPLQFKSFDPRTIVEQSTGVRIDTDPRGVRARKVAEEMDAALERYWEALAQGERGKALAEYHAACQAAIKLQISPPADASQRTIAELVARIEALERNAAMVNDRSALQAVFDMVPVPVPTFRECAEQYIAAHKAGWSNPKHANQWVSTLKTYAYPIIGGAPVARLSGREGTHAIKQILDPIWYTKSTTASRVRGRIEKILDWAQAQGFRAGDNPARWDGHLQAIYPTPQKVMPVRHHAAMAYRRIPEFMCALRQQEGIGARALEFTILTAARTSEVLHARRKEIDRDARLWVVPPERMKKRREHRVPLSNAALAIVDSLPPDSAYLFPGRNPDKPLNNKTMLRVLERMGVASSEAVTHGFRSAFRDWGGEEGDYSPELMRLATAHKVDDEVEAAYRRGSMLKKRHALMADWERFCSGAPEAGSETAAAGGNSTSKSTEGETTAPDRARQNSEA